MSQSEAEEWTAPMETYRRLLWHHMEEMRENGHTPKRERIFHCIETMREVFPEDVARFEAMYGSKDESAAA